MQTTTNVVAVGGVTYPLWMQWVEALSSGAAVIMPILGVIWLSTQIFTTWGRYRKDKR